MSIASALMLNEIGKSLDKLSGKVDKVDNGIFKVDMFEYSTDKWLGIGNKDQKIILQHSLGVKPDMVAILPSHYDWNENDYPDHGALYFDTLFAGCVRFFAPDNRYQLMYEIYDVESSNYYKSFVASFDTDEYCITSADDKTITFVVSNTINAHANFAVPPKKYITYKVIAIKYT